MIISISVDIETSKRLQGSTAGAQYMTIKILMRVIFNFVIFFLNLILVFFFLDFFKNVGKRGRSNRINTIYIQL